jgi:hypothetical protein
MCFDSYLTLTLIRCKTVACKQGREAEGPTTLETLTRQRLVKTAGSEDFAFAVVMYRLYELAITL